MKGRDDRKYRWFSQLSRKREREKEKLFIESTTMHVMYMVVIKVDVIENDGNVNGKSPPLFLMCG